MCQDVFDNDARWKYYDPAQTLLFAKILSSCNVIYISCRSIANFVRPSISHSGEWDDYFGKEKNQLISYIGLEKDVKWALGGSHFNNLGRWHPDNTLCLAEDQPLYHHMREGIRKLTLIPNGTCCINSRFAPEVNENEQPHNF